MLDRFQISSLLIRLRKLARSLPTCRDLMRRLRHVQDVVLAILDATIDLIDLRVAVYHSVGLLLRCWAPSLLATGRGLARLALLFLLCQSSSTNDARITSVLIFGGGYCISCVNHQRWKGRKCGDVARLTILSYVGLAPTPEHLRCLWTYNRSHGAPPSPDKSP